MATRLATTRAPRAPAPAQAGDAHDLVSAVLAKPTGAAALGGPPESVRDEAEFVARVERALETVCLAGGALLEAATPMVLARTSKRARARLAWTLARGFGVADAVALDVAVAVELVHAASLLHDDVLDQATSRRGVTSVNAVHGDVVAVLAGDLLLTLAMERVLALGAEAGRVALTTIGEMSRAVASEAWARGRVLSRGAWAEMAEGKTGALFGVVADLIGVAAGDDEGGRRFARALRFLGIAFQAADDRDDFVAGGERPLVDLRDGNPSLVMTLACERSPELQSRLEAAWRARPLGDELLGELGAAVLAPAPMPRVEAFARESIEAARLVLSPELARGDARSAAALRMLAWAAPLAGGASPSPVAPAGMLGKTRAVPRSIEGERRAEEGGSGLALAPSPSHRVAAGGDEERS